MNTTIQYTLDFMEEIINIPSPAGYTYECIDKIDDEFKQLGFEVTRTPKNALVVTVDGENTENQKLIVGHVDTLGGMVKEVKPNGRLLLAQLGGFSWNSVEGENVYIITNEDKRFTGTILPIKASIHVHSDIVRTMERTDDNIEVRIDEFTSTKEETNALGINVGDFVAFEPRFKKCENGFIKTRHIDDKSAVAIILGLCKHLKDHDLKLKYTTHFYISNYEEVGHGVSYVPEKTDEIIAIDIGTVGPKQESTETSVCISAKDSRTPYDFDLRNRLANLCKANDIEYKVDVYHRYGSDASVGVLQGFDVNYACIGPGVDATHHYERTHINSIKNTMLLLMKYLIQE